MQVAVVRDPCIGPRVTGAINRDACKDNGGFCPLRAHGVFECRGFVFFFFDSTQMLTDLFGSCIHAPFGHRHFLFRHYVRVQRLEERLSDTATVDERAETCDDCLRELMTYLELKTMMVSMCMEDHDEVFHQWERHDQIYISSLNRHDLW